MTRIKLAALVAVIAAVAIFVATDVHGRTKIVTAPTIPVTASPPVKDGATSPPAASSPSCAPEVQRAIEAGRGELGICQPKPMRPGLLSTPSGSTGPDVSNNDPISSWHAVKSHGHPFGYTKVIQGTSFVDSTASSAFAGMRHAGIVPGGYDFLEVCRTSASGEARLFASRLKAIGLHDTLAPVGDAEWPLSPPCSVSAARAWLISWSSTVHSELHRWPAIYSGAWWANPNLGCWRPPHALRWVSGYTSRAGLPIPCGWAGVDLWQYTDAGFNGASASDMSRLETSLAKFEGSSEPTPAQKRAAKEASLRSHRKEVAELHGDIDRHHCRKGKPWYGHAKPARYHTLCERWLKLGKTKTATVKRLEHELAHA